MHTNKRHAKALSAPPNDPQGVAPIGLSSPRLLVIAVLFGEALAAVLALGTSETSWVFFGLASLAAQWIILLALAAAYLLRSKLAGGSARQLARVYLALLVASTVIVLAAAAALMPALGNEIPGGWLGLAVRSVAIVGLVGTLALIAFQNHLDARQLAIRTKQAELDVLHARIRPHFLFNALNTAAALLHARPDLAEKVLLDLSDLFRAALGTQAMIPLQEELALSKRYVDIEACRFGDRLAVAWDVPEHLPAIDVPSLSIQPLVENAVRHGIEPSRAGGIIAVTVRALADRVRIEISSPASDPSRPSKPGSGVGLRASVARITDATHGRGSVSSGAAGDVYVTRIELPLDG